MDPAAPAFPCTPVLPLTPLRPTSISPQPTVPETATCNAEIRSVHVPVCAQCTRVIRSVCVCAHAAWRTSGFRVGNGRDEGSRSARGGSSRARMGTSHCLGCRGASGGVLATPGSARECAQSAVVRTVGRKRPGSSRLCAVTNFRAQDRSVAGEGERGGLRREADRRYPRRTRAPML